MTIVPEEGEEDLLCCPICSRVWTNDESVFQREVHVNLCLEKVNSFDTFEICTQDAVLHCPICSQQLLPGLDGELHVSKCLETEQQSTQVDTQEDPASSECPVCLNKLDRLEIHLRIRHIKACAREGNVLGPRILEEHNTEGCLDNLLETIEKLENEPADEGKNQTLEKKVLFPSEQQKITKYFESLTPKSARPVKTKFKSRKPWFSCPGTKKIPNTDVIVDGFEYAAPELSKIYFLSHFHADHYIGLNKDFDFGTIYCTTVTARLAHYKLKIAKNRFKVLHVGEELFLPEQKIKVVCYDANHAPGSCVFIFFHTEDRKIYVHTGDFRANETLAKQIKLFAAKLFLPVESIFLDTTYCNPKYSFPPQKDAIQKCFELISDHLERSKHQRTLVVFGVYTIGKEKLALFCCQKNHERIYVSKTKMSILKCYDDFKVSELAKFTSERSQSNIWMIPMCQLEQRRLNDILRKNQNRFDAILAIRPTGWVMNFKKEKISPTITNLYVPYSEHSSFTELKKFVRDINAKSIVPTVICKGTKKEEMLNFLFY